MAIVWPLTTLAPQALAATHSATSPAKGQSSSLSPSPSRSNSVSDVVTAAAALGAAVIAGGFTWLVAKQSRVETAQSRTEAAQATAASQLRNARQRAADDVRALAELGAELEKAIASAREDPETPARRSDVLAACSCVATRLEFIWDDDLKRAMTDFTNRGKALADAELAEDFEKQSRESDRAWTTALERSGVIWRVLVTAAVEVDELMPPTSGAPPVAADRPHLPVTRHGAPA